MTRSTDYHLCMALIGAVCTLGLASALVPAVEHAVSLGLVALAGLVLLGQAVRLLARWVRERREDRADLAYAAAVHANRPHTATTAEVQR